MQQGGCTEKPITVIASHLTSNVIYEISVDERPECAKNLMFQDIIRPSSNSLPYCTRFRSTKYQTPTLKARLLFAVIICLFYFSPRNITSAKTSKVTLRSLRLPTPLFLSRSPPAAILINIFAVLARTASKASGKANVR